MPVIPATQEAEIRRIAVKVSPMSKKPSPKRAGGVAQGVGSEFKHKRIFLYHKRIKLMTLILR
jgi:hypothetical protein